jgi:ferredoxin
VLNCGSNAIAYVLGDLLIDLEKCAECGRRGIDSDSIPGCVISCEYSRDKAILEPLSVRIKQERAASALSLQKV